MGPRLVFVHGIGRPRVAAQVLAEWTSALAKGAEKAGRPDFAQALADGAIDVRFGYYGDLFGPAQAQGGGELELDELEARILAELMAAVVEDRLETPVDEQDRLLLEHALAQSAPPGQAQGLLEPVRASINIATTMLAVKPLRKSAQWAAPKLMVLQLAQVARYLARSERDADGVTFDQRIRARVAEALDGAPAEALCDDAPTVAVAHSLGSVVAFETLAERGAPVEAFVTIGSPLAMRTVVLPRLLPQPPRTPECVRKWLNFWDRDDIFTGRPQLADDIGANDAGVVAETTKVDSDGLWVHSATKYLEQKYVAEAIALAFASPTPPAAPR